MASKAALIKHDDALKERARDMYLAHVPHNEISAELKISSATIATWRKAGDWATLRKAQDEAIIDDLAASRRRGIVEINDRLIVQLKRCVQGLEQRIDPLTLAEAEKVSVILSTLHRVSQLDQNRATENLGVNLNVTGQLSVEKIREAILADPFLSSTASSPITKE